MVDLNGEQALTLAERAVKSTESAVATLDRLAPSVEKAADAASKAPALLSDERKEVIKAINEDLTQTVTFLQSERLETVKQISEQFSDERIAALAHLTQERIAAMKEMHVIIAEERIESLKELEAIATAERKALSQEIERTGFQARGSCRLVDYAIRRGDTRISFPLCHPLPVPHKGSSFSPHTSPAGGLHETCPAAESPDRDDRQVMIDA
jgi:hypothetical protein